MTADERPTAAITGSEREEADYIVLNALRVLLEAAVKADQLDPPRYDARNLLVLQAIGAAAACGIPVGIRLDAKEPEWPVVYFELPAVGQVSWHLPQHEQPWDGHSTEEKNRRVTAYADRIQERIQERGDG